MYVDLTVIAVLGLSALEGVLIVLLLLERNRLLKASAELERRLVTIEGTEARLRQSEARYRAVVEDQTELICRFLPDGTYTFVNAAYCRYFQRSSEELLGRTFYELIPPEGHAAARAFLASITPDHSLSSRDHEVIAPGGERRWQQWSDRGFFDEQGRIIEYQAVGRDITELKRAEESLRQLEAQKQVEAALRETSQRKDEFLAMLAHELRNPLAPIATSLEIMRRAEPAELEVRNARDVIARQVLHLTRLVDDLLDVSRITRGQINVVLEPVDLREVVRQAVETSNTAISRGRHPLSIELPPGDLCVQGDAVRLTQVVSNLLNNAGKHSGPGTSIRVNLRREGTEAVLSVKDSDIGIPDGMHERIFEPFAQLPAGDRVREGLGVGLTLVKRLVEIHEGRIEVLSDGWNRGSEFVVRLPALPPSTSENIRMASRTISGVVRIAGDARKIPGGGRS